MIRFLLCLFALVMGSAAHADELRPGYLEFAERAPGEWTLIWKSPIKGGVTPHTLPVLPAGCTNRGEPAREFINATLVTTYAVRCTGDVSGKSIGLADFDASQTDALVRVQPLARPLQALRLTAAQPMAEIAARPGRWQVARTYFATGVEHILEGYDHFLFVVALVLLLHGFWTIAKAVTAFTIAHSITLVGTTLGFMGLAQRPVECVIALSIIFLAVEIVKKTPDAQRLSERITWVVAFGFGLLHGFGFAGALQEIGLPEGDVPTALLTFNLGVEAGQLLIVAITMAVLAILRRVTPQIARPAIRFAAYGIGIVASYWFIERMVA